jgi:hypothetical protein
LIRDPGNPRSLAGSLERLVADSSATNWPTGTALATSALDALSLELVELIPTVRARLAEFSQALTSHWFAAPVSPVVLSGNVADPSYPEAR